MQNKLNTCFLRKVRLKILKVMHLHASGHLKISEIQGKRVKKCKTNETHAMDKLVDLSQTV